MRIEKAADIGRADIPGYHPCGGGLYLQVGKTGGTKSWICRVYRLGKAHDIGVGKFPAISLSLARAAAAALRQQVARGGDPLAERRAALAEEQAERRTFASVSDEYIREIVTPSIRNKRSPEQWRSSLQVHAAALQSMTIDKIEVTDMLRVLRPIWTTKHVTAMRVRQRCEKILRYAAKRGWRSGDNPASLEALEDLLARHRHEVAHYAALPIADMPAVMAKLGKSKGMAARCAMWTILTACRPSEGAGAVAAELDIEAATWTIPKGRTGRKTGKAHIVPLSRQALTLIADDATGVLFPNPDGDALSLTALSKALRVAGGGGATLHGTARSTFRDWASEIAEVEEVVAEAALSHQRGGGKDKGGARTVGAYARLTLVERRRRLMQQWADYCLPPGTGDNVVTLPARQVGR